MRLNLGAGECPLEGFENWDRMTGQECYPLAVADGSCDEIRASHILEHFGHRQTLDVLRDWCRALKDGGVLKVAVPDFDFIVRCILSNKNKELPIECWIMGSQSDANDFHGAIFNEYKLSQQMEMVGLTNIQKWKSEVNDCASFDVSLNLMGVK